MTELSNRDRVLNALAESPACDDCLTTATGITSRHNVNEVCRMAELRGFLLRQKERCPRAGCGRFKTVNHLRDVPAPPDDAPGAGDRAGGVGTTVTEVSEEEAARIFARSRRVPRVGRPPKRAASVHLVPAEERLLGSFRFIRVGDLAPELDGHGAILLEDPAARYAKAAEARLHAYGKGPFCRFRIPLGWAGAQGVYAILDGDAVRYVGECVDLHQRFQGYGSISPRNCYPGGRETNCRINREVLQAAQAGRRLTLWFHATDQHKGTEAQLRRDLRPPWNRV